MRSSGEPRRPGRLATLTASLELGTLTVAVVGIATVLVAAALRITYPYELEWMEGGVLDHVARLRTGQPIYVEPTFQFVPFIYPPLYYYLAAAVMEITGDGFLGPRLVSLAASIGCMAVIFLFVRRETRRRLPALCAAALYAVTYPVVDGWFDVARVDGLFPLFVLGGAFLIRFGSRARCCAVAGLLLACAFFSKQSTVVFAAPLLLFQLVHEPRRFGVLLATGVVPCGLISGYLHWRTNGWFTYYLFSLPRQHAWLGPSHYADFWLADLLRHVPIALMMVAAIAILRFRTRRQRPAWDFYAALLIGGLAVSWSSRLHEGGGVNVIMPALAVIAVLFGFAMAYLPQSVDGLKKTSLAARQRLKAVISLAVICQLLWLAFNPWDWVPTGADRKAGDELVARIRGFEGDVIIPSAPYLAALAGKPTMAHQMALSDVLRASGSTDVKRKLTRQINRELGDLRYDAILLFWSGGWFPGTPIPDEYVYTGKVFQSPGVFRPKSGAKQFVPTELFVRRQRVH